MVTLEQFRYHPTQAARSAACFDFHYSQPGIVAIFGDSGSGKSTLAQIMAGWYPDFLPGDIEGKGTLLGIPIGQQSLVERAQTIQLGPAITLSPAFRLYLQRRRRGRFWP